MRAVRGETSGSRLGWYGRDVFPFDADNRIVGRYTPT
jgi:hypothetical protein